MCRVLLTCLPLIALVPWSPIFCQQPKDPAESQIISDFQSILDSVHFTETHGGVKT
jgi:hypothetical protein